VSAHGPKINAAINFYFLGWRSDNGVSYTKKVKLLTPIPASSWIAIFVGCTIALFIQTTQAN